MSFDVMSIVSLCQLLATELGVISTQITKADKAEHIKRKRHTAAQTAHSSKNGFNGEKEIMMYISIKLDHWICIVDVFSLSVT